MRTEREIPEGSAYAQGVALALRARQGLPVPDGLVECLLSKPGGSDGYSFGLTSPKNFMYVKPCWMSGCTGKCTKISERTRGELN